MIDDSTTIRLRKTTRNTLARIGKKGESFDEIITRILNELNNYHSSSDYVIGEDILQKAKKNIEKKIAKTCAICNHSRSAHRQVFKGLKVIGIDYNGKCVVKGCKCKEFME